jgi:hypothetical protein
VVPPPWEISPPLHSSLPSPPSEMDYAALPSPLVLVAAARSSTTPWEAPTGPETNRTPKELRHIGNYVKIKAAWDLVFRLGALLESMNLYVFGFGKTAESSAHDIFWIDIMPASLTGDNRIVVASRCQALFREFGLFDVNVEIRESVVTRSASPKLLTSTHSSHTTVSVCEPLTTTLSLTIFAQSMPCAGSADGNTERHPIVHNNFDDTSFKRYLDDIKSEIGGKVLVARHQERRIKAVEGKDNPAANEERQKAQAELDKATEAREKLAIYYRDLSTRWGNF